MKLVVVEGPDGSGKSTLIDNLRYHTSRHFLTVRRSGPPRDKQLLTECVQWLQEVSYTKLSVVCDRHPLISEPIYGMVLRGENLLEGCYATGELRTIFQTGIARVIYCRPSDATIFKYLSHQPQLKGVTAKIGELIEAYDSLMGEIAVSMKIPVRRYDWHDEPTTSIENLFFGE